MSQQRPEGGAAAQDVLALDQQFCFALYSASHAMTRTYKLLLDQIGLTYPQYLVMLVLWETDGLLVKQIGARLFLDSGTLTPLLKRLEANGLLSRTRDSSDERQVRIELSELGRALRAKARQIPRQVLCASGLHLDALGQMRAELVRVRDDLFKALDPEQ
jgi:DNA-binding MarR family transcriptional regulator